MKDSAENQGTVICFYSYKGGTGRTMAATNVGCALAERDRRPVLLIDWDLEAPGMHRFFETVGDWSMPWQGREAELRNPGVVDLFWQLWEKVRSIEHGDEETARQLLRGIRLEKFFVRTPVPNVSLMTTGMLDTAYADRVSSFPWMDLFHKMPSLFRVVAETLGEKFRYVIVDSRTGLTDTAGICTTLMPEKLVVVFTPNRQSLTGVTGLIERATSYRRESEDLRPLTVYPLASRIDATEEDLRREWRFGDGTVVAIGYQRQFENALRSAYDLHRCDLTTYFDEVQIQHVPRYAYGEDLSVLAEPTGDRLSLARSYRAFAEVLASSSAPWTAFDRSAAYRSAGSRWYVGRVYERREFVLALESAESSTILAIEGEWGTGKTSLLQTYLETCQQRNIPAALINLSQAITSTAFAQEIAEQLAAAGQPLLRYESIRSTLASASGQLNVRRQRGSPEIEPGADPQYEPSSAVPEFDALVMDLLEQPRNSVTVLLFDDYDLAYPEIRWCVDAVLVPAITRLPTSGLVVVVAGRELGRTAVEDVVLSQGTRHSQTGASFTKIELTALSEKELGEMLAVYGFDGYNLQKWLPMLSAQHKAGMPLAQIVQLANMLTAAPNVPAADSPRLP